MRQVFYGASIQGAKDFAERKSRSAVNRAFIDAIKKQGYSVFSEHTAGADKRECSDLLSKEIGPFPKDDVKRRIHIRRSLISAVESPDIVAGIFEVTVPSYGTSNELTHAYMRPRLGIPEIPILLLCQNGYNSHGLSAMIEGISPEEIPSLSLVYYKSVDEGLDRIVDFLESV